MSSNLVTDKIRNMFDLSRWKDSDQFFLCPKLVKKQITFPSLAGEKCIYGHRPLAGFAASIIDLLTTYNQSYLVPSENDVS